MSQRITSNHSGSFAADDPVDVQGEAIAIVLRQALAEASALGGEDQQIEQITFEVGDGVQAWGGPLGGPLGVSFELQVVTRLR